MCSQSTSGKYDVFIKPTADKVIKLKQQGNYDKLDDNGFPYEESKVKQYDIIIGKITPNVNEQESEKQYIDTGKQII